MPLISVILSVWFHTICHWSAIPPSISMSTRVWQTQFEQNVHFYPQVCGHWAALSLLALNFPLSNSFRDSHPGSSYFILFEKITRGIYGCWALFWIMMGFQRNLNFGFMFTDKLSNCSELNFFSGLTHRILYSMFWWQEIKLQYISIICCWQCFEVFHLDWQWP